jgi:hypothetical protein
MRNVDLRQLTFPPGLHLLSHGFEIPLHPVDAYRDAVDERERLRVLCEHWGEGASDNVSELTDRPQDPGPLSNQ